MTKDELIAQIKTWRTQDANAFDAVAQQISKLRGDTDLLLQNLLNQLSAAKSSISSSTTTVLDQLILQKNQTLASLDTILTAAAVADPVVVPAPAPTPAPTQDRVGILVPLYSYPGGSGLLNWDAVIAAAPKVPIILVANPASGPGNAVNSDYVKAIARAKASGAKVLGYVSTVYGNRSVADVKADIVKWKSFYGVVDIFLDEMANNLANVPKYTDYVNFIKANGGYTVANPGASCIQEYRTVANVDTILLSEKGGDINPAPAWAIPAPDKYFAGICYATDQAKALELVAKSRTLGYGWIYVTNDTYTNPWDSLPTYWLTFVDAVAKLV